MKKLTAALLLVVFVFQLIGINAFASESRYSCGDYWYVLQNDGTAEITGYTGNTAVLSIPATLDGYRVTSIGVDAFADCDSLQSVTLPEGLVSIGASAFADCDSLQSVTLPDSLISMNWNPFNTCDNLTEIHVSADHSVYELVDGVLFDKIDKKLIFYPCAFTASSYTVPEGTRIIGAGAFAYCDSLQSVTLPETLVSIEAGAFAYCDSLQSVTLPETLVSIGWSAFAHCGSLQSVTLPETLVSIEDGAFLCCDSLQSVTLPETLVSIGRKAFAHCGSLQSVTLPETLVSIEYGAFANCDSLQSVTLPEGLVSIGENAFLDCDSLQSVTLQEGLKTIGSYAFQFCSSLQSVTLPEGLEIIGDHAFQSCSSLQSVTLPEGLEIIGDFAFDCCLSLKSITIPSSVTIIDYHTFSYCNSLTLEVAENSYAHTYAIENDIPFVLNANETDATISKTQSEVNDFAAESQYYSNESTSDLDEVIAICKKYSDGNTVNGVRNQIDWMNQLYSAISQDFVGQLGLGDTLLIALLNHTDINTALMTSSYSTGDINREVAKIILTGAEGYAEVASIAKATGLKETDVRDILERIVAGGITEKTIDTGKESSSFTNRGPYLQNQALEQEKVWQYLIAEVERMTGNPESLAILCQDLGAGYVNSMMAGQKPDSYKVSLYKEYLAKTVDAVLDSKNPYLTTLYEKTIKSDTYNVTKKTCSVLSEIFSYEVGAEKDALSDELKAFWDEHLKNGVLSESEAREYLILSGEYKKGEHGIGEAAKQLVKGYKHLQRFKTALDKAGKVFKAVDILEKGVEVIEYWATNYAEQEIMLDALVESLSQSGADMELMTAARELQQEYNDKLAGTFDKAYVAMIEKGVDTLKSAFPPLLIAESVISLSGTITGADKKAEALETGLAMQGICSQVLDEYEKAVIAVSEGDTSKEAASRVLTTFETARQSMILYCEAMIELAETDAQKETYSYELQKLQQAEFGYSTVSLKEATNTFVWNNHTYSLFNKNMTWNEAKAYCESLGGHLVTITTDVENDAIVSAFGSDAKNCYWVGLYRETTNMEWKWVTGEEISYTNWASNEPNDDRDQGECYVHMFGKEYTGGLGTKYAGDWNDASDDGALYASSYYDLNNFGFICEFDKLVLEPSEEAYVMSNDSLPEGDSFISLSDDTKESTAQASTTEPVVDIAAFEAAFQHTANKSDKELALQSAIASQKAYSEQEIYAHLVSLGFNGDSIMQKDYEASVPHSVAITIANRVVTDEKGVPKTLYALIIRGTEGKAEWISNFDVGFSDIAHGFNQAAIRVMGHFARYVNEYPPLNGNYSTGNYLLWTCGHSRGAAVANLIAGNYITKHLKSDNVYAYTFATPNVDKNATICKNIYNFIIDGDLVPRLPLSKWGFERYGLTIYYSKESINGIILNSNRNTTMFTNLLAEKVETQEEYAKRTKAVLQALKGEPALGIELYELKVVLSALLSGATAVDVFAEVGKSSATVYVARLMDYFGANLNADELFFTAKDLEEFFSLILPSHSKDTYLEWMKQISAKAANASATPAVVSTPSPTSNPTTAPTVTLIPTISETSIGGMKNQSITGFVIPYGVTKIEDSAFSNCSELTSITIPDSVTSIGDAAFYGCSKLKNIIMPESITNIGDQAFENCYNLMSITIPDGVTRIGDKTFSLCLSLTSITLPDSIESIGNDAFRGCESLVSITIPDGVTSIGDFAFSYCSSLTNVTIPDGVTSIGEEVFSSCSSLTDITIPDSVTSIGDYAFAGCTSLTSLTLPDSVTSIGNNAFWDCEKLTLHIATHGKKNKDATTIKADLLASNYLPEKNLSIGDFCIDSWKIDAVNNVDTVDVSFKAYGDNLAYALSYTLTYELHNDDWLLKEAEITSMDVYLIRR